MIIKVLQVNNFHYPKGGSDRYFLEITHLLREAGHEVRTFSSGHPGNIDEELLVVPPVRGTDTERAGGIGNVLQFLFSREARQRMREALEKFKPDLVHLHIYYGQLTASILQPLREAGIPIIQTLHEYKLVCATHGLYANGQFCDACQGQHFWQAVVKKCNRRSIARSGISMTESYLSNALGARDSVQRFIAVSAFQKNQLVRLGVPENKVTVLYHFTDNAPFPPARPGEYFLFVGRILTEKGIGVLLDAYARLGKSAPILKIVGTGIDRYHWQTQAVESGLADRIEWLGFKTGEELARLYRGCLALINPSLLNETFGLTCLEALAQGRPVIASRVGAFPEVITHGVDGLLVEPGSPDALAEAMDQMLGSPERALAMGHCGFAKVNRQFSKKHHYENLYEVYKEMIA